MCSLNRFAKEFGWDEWKPNSGWVARWKKHYDVQNKAVSGERGDAPDCTDFLDSVVKPLIAEYGPENVYNADETAAYYKMLPHRTNCLRGEDPAGHRQYKDRLTLLLICNMTGSDKVKPIMIGKAAKPQCLKAIYNMTPAQLPCDWYASKKAWMNTKIFLEIMTKWNNKLSIQRKKIVLFLDNASSHALPELSHIKLVFLPPNATSKVQPLDAGIL